MTRARNLSKLSNPATFTVDTDNNVGVNSTIPKEKLNIVGVVSATSFFGDGSSLSGITGGATLGAASGSQRVVVTSLTSGTMTDAGTDADFAWNSTTNTLSATNINVSGTLTYEDVTNVDSLGLGTFRNGLIVQGTGTTSTTLNVSGFSTFNAIRLGDGNDSSTNNIKFGADDDLEIYHNGSHAFLQNDTGNVYLRSSSGTSINIEPAAGASGITATAGGDVQLFHNNALKLSTASIGATVTGSLLVGAGQSFGSIDGATAVYYGDGSNLTGISVGLSTEAFTSSGIVTAVRLSTAQDHKITATGLTTITSSGSGTEGESHTIRIVNSGIATVGFSTYFLFPSGAAPSLPTADGAISLISFTVHDSVGAGCTQLLAGASVNYS